MPANEDTRLNGYIPERKRSAQALKTSGGRTCQRLVTTRLYIMRRICKVAFGKVVDKSNPSRPKNVKPAWSALPFRSWRKSQMRQREFSGKNLGIN